MMHYIAWFILGITTIHFLVSFINLVFSDRMKKIPDNTNQMVSVLIPARNEENNIGPLIENILKQEYQNFELLIGDDQSDDNTKNIVEKYMESDYRIKLIEINELPKNWLGKTYACYILSKHARGKYFLFLDADVRITDKIIARSVSYTERKNLGLISVFPKQIMHSRGEKITVPVMNYILLTMLPLVFVRILKYRSIAAANGQFMFFNASKYKELNPHKHMKLNRVEDIAIARFYKSEKVCISCQVSDGSVVCRMYSSFNEAVQGFSKNVIDFFGNSYAIAILSWMINTLGFLFILFLLKGYYILLYFALYVLTRIFVSIRSRQNIIDNILLIIPQQLSFGLFIYYSVKNNLKKEFVWKGRNI
jgi:glycosyltransferase involved in cell wall biosynthesis